MGCKIKFCSLGDAQVGFWLCNAPSLLPSIISVNLYCKYYYLCCYLLLNVFELFFSQKRSCIVTHYFIFFSSLKFNPIIRKLHFFHPLITLVWQTADFTDTRSLQRVLETKRGKKLLGGKPCIMESIWHVVSNHRGWFFGFVGFLVFFWRQKNPPINFILQKKKSATGLIE